MKGLKMFKNKIVSSILVGIFSTMVFTACTNTEAAQEHKETTTMIKENKKVDKNFDNLPEKYSNIFINSINVKKPIEKLNIGETGFITHNEIYFDSKNNNILVNPYAETNNIIENTWYIVIVKTSENSYNAIIDKNSPKTWIKDRGVIKRPNLDQQLSFTENGIKVDKMFTTNLNKLIDEKIKKAPGNVPK